MDKQKKLILCLKGDGREMTDLRPSKLNKCINTRFQCKSEHNSCQKMYQKMAATENKK